MDTTSIVPESIVIQIQSQMQSEDRLRQTTKSPRQRGGHTSQNDPQHKKDLNRLAGETKDHIHTILANYRQVLDTREEELASQVDNILLSEFERIDSLRVDPEPDNLNKSPDQRQIFTPILSRLQGIMRTGQTSDNTGNSKLEDRLEAALVKQQKAKEKLNEYKRKYKGKSKSQVPSLPTLPTSALSARFKRQNQMLIEHNANLSNRLIELESENSNLRSGSEDTTRCKYNTIDTTLPNENVDGLYRQIQNLTDQLSESNRRLLEKEEELYGKKNQLEEVTHRFDEEKTRVEILKQTIRSLQRKMLTMNHDLGIAQDEASRLLQVNTGLQLEKQGLIRKEILQDVMKQLNEQLQLNETLRKQQQQSRNKLVVKESELRSRQVQFAEKIDEFSLVSQRQFQESKTSYTRRMQQMQSEYQSRVNYLQKQLKAIQGTTRCRDSQTHRLKEELECTKDQLKLTKKTKKQQFSKKQQAEKEKQLSTHQAEIKAISDQVSTFRLEYKTLKESYQNKIKLVESKYRLIKERFQLEVLSRLERGKLKSKLESNQVAQTLIESFSNYVHKEAVITKLTKEVSELRSKKEKGPDSHKVGQVPTAQQDIILVRQQILEERARVEKSICQEKIYVTQERLKKEEAHSIDLTNHIQELQSKLQALKSENRQLQKRVKQKPKVEVVQPQSVVQELRSQIQALRLRCSEAKKEKDDMQLQTKTRKEALAHLKATLKQSDSELSRAKQQMEQLKQELQKSRKNIKQFQRKEQVFRDNKDKLETVRSLERENSELKQQIEQKTRWCKAQLNKRDSVIKLMKEKEVSDTIRQVSRIDIKTNDDDSLQDQMKKLRTQIDRKDSLVKIYKQKIEKLEQHIEKQERTYEQRISKEKSQSHRQTRRAEQLKLDNKRLESDIFTSKGILRKIYEGYCSIQEVPKAQKKTPSEIPNMEIFSEGLSILNIKPEDVQRFLPGTNAPQTSGAEKMETLMGKILQLIPVIKEQIYQ